MALSCYNLFLEPNARLESIQGLTELSKLHPFTNTSGWSEDVASLRLKAIESPEKINMKSIEKHFTTLRLSDMNVSDVWYFVPFNFHTPL